MNIQLIKIHVNKPAVFPEWCKTLTLFTILSLGSFNNSFSQMKVLLGIEHGEKIGNDYFFDVYLRKGPGLGPDSLYLGSSDFVITFNLSNFINPSITKMDVTYCTLRPLESNPSNDANTQFNYHSLISQNIDENEIIINLAGVDPSDQNYFDARIARIGVTPNAHRLARFKISGAQSQNANLKWKTEGDGRITKIFGLEDEPEFMSHQVELYACPNILNIPVGMLVDNFYQAEQQLISLGTVVSGSNVSLNAGQTIDLGPPFSVEANSTVEINIHGCQ